MMKTAKALQSVSLVALIVGLLFVGSVRTAYAPGFGATCLNRHDARIFSVLVHATATNYTGNGNEQVAAWLWGYDVTIFVKVNTSIMMNAQPDTYNGSIFFANDIGGAWYPHCYYNISPYITLATFQSHPANVTNFENAHQTVSLSTGTTNGQYDVSWIGP